MDIVARHSRCVHESLWIEAAHLDGVRGHCWPMGRPEMHNTDGRWGLSGPGWAAEWYMAGSSMFYHEQGFDEFWRPGGTSAASNCRGSPQIPFTDLADLAWTLLLAESGRRD